MCEREKEVDDEILGAGVTDQALPSLAKDSTNENKVQGSFRGKKVIDGCLSFLFSFFLLFLSFFPSSVLGGICRIGESKKKVQQRDRVMTIRAEFDTTN